MKGAGCTRHVSGSLSELALDEGLEIRFSPELRGFIHYLVEKLQLGRLSYSYQKSQNFQNAFLSGCAEDNLRAKDLSI